MFTYYFVAIVVFLVGAFVLQGLRRITANPPHVALVTFLGKRIEKVKQEGWRFFPIHPYLYSFIEIPVQKVDHDLKSQLVKTPDLADVEIPISLTWTPDYKNEPGLLITYLNSGGETGVKNILENIVKERLREWAFSDVEGPQNWKEAQAAQESAVAILLKAIIGDALDHIPSSIPTSILLKYFSHPRKPLTLSEKEKWGENFEKMEEILKNENRDEIERAVNKRREEIIKVRQGNGHFQLQQLGIVINRLNIGEIKPQGKIVEATELLSKEHQERKAEVFEVQTDLLKAQELVNQLRTSGKEISLDDAFRIIMEWKTTREGRGFTIPGVAPALAEVAKIFVGKGGN